MGGKDFSRVWLTRNLTQMKKLKKPNFMLGFFFSLKVQKLRKTGCRPKIFPPPGDQSDDVILFNPQDP